MKISKNWLCEFLSSDLTVNEISEYLTNLGLEVEGLESYETIKGSLEGILVGKILKCYKHPNADKLKITEVEISKSVNKQIICGANNVKVGQKVAVATVGSTLYDKNHNEIKIKKTKIRGEISEGMICSEYELNIGDSHEGILELDSNTKIGTSLNNIYKCEKDYILEIGITPNRGDALSHFGVARDLKAKLIHENIPFKWMTKNNNKFKIDNNSFSIKVNVEKKILVKKYYGLTISNIKVSESNNKVKNKLISIGVNPVNNIVDITNLILHEIGQPLHAFDANKISGKVIVKSIKKPQKFKTLDNTIINVGDDDILICDEKKPLCLAGIIGGLDSGVSNKTKNIFLESAYFDPESIRKTSKKHNIQTESSYRFERGIDPNNCLFALKRAALLIKEYASGEISSEIQEFNLNDSKDEPIFLSFNKLFNVIGQKIESNKIINILKSLEVEILNLTSDGILIKVPSYRVDVKRDIDVIEDILRIYGFNNIKGNKKLISFYPSPTIFEKKSLQNKISNKLINLGFYEVLNNSLTSPKNQNHAYKAVKILNPLGVEYSELRTSMLYSMIDNAKYNINRQNNNLKLFEFGSIYHNEKSNSFSEIKKIGIMLCGDLYENRWNNNQVETDFFVLKGYVDMIFNNLEITNFKISKNKSNIFSDSINYEKDNVVVCSFGEVNKSIINRYSIDNSLFFAEINFDLICKLLIRKISINKVSKFPLIKRDLSILLDKNIEYESIKQISYSVERNILKKIELFDVYVGENIPQNKKSYAMSFTFIDKNKTLTDNKVDQVINKLILEFKKKLNAEIRK